MPCVGAIVTALEIIETGFGIVVVATVTDGVDVAAPLLYHALPCLSSVWKEAKSRLRCARGDACGAVKLACGK